MSPLFILFLLFIQFSLFTCDYISLNNSNCSLSFTVQTIYHTNKIQTDFPIELVANYNLTCNVEHLMAYYKITPLAILVVGYYKNEEENIKSMIELNSTQFRFNINQSSTIRLCVVSDDDDDDSDEDDYNDNDYRICRQIHIGINNLYNFWSLPMEIFYICITCLIGIYYIFIFLRDKWRKSGKKAKPKPKPVIRKSISAYEKKHDTFENEKVRDGDMSDEDE